MAETDAESPDLDTPTLTASSLAGNALATQRLTEALYSQLRAMAGRHMRQESPNHTLQATALVHEAYGRLIGADLPVQDRSHFLALMSMQMRRVLLDHARGKRRDKRGGDVVRVSIDEVATLAGAVGAGAGAGAGSDADLVQLDAALQALGRHDPRKERVLEMTYFGGMTQTEVAAALTISPATVDRDLRLARAWIRLQLDAPGAAPG